MPDPVLNCAFARGPLTNAIIAGRVSFAGYAVRHQSLPLHEIFDRAFAEAPFDLCELSFGRYIAALGSDRGRLQYRALPVFTLRRFRYGIIHVRDDSSVTAPEDLAGRRVGCPAWAQTALVAARGHLLAEHGITAAAISWVLGGVNQPAAPRAPLLHRADIRVAMEAERPLATLLATHEIDAVVALEAPVPPPGSAVPFRTLFRDPAAAGAAALKRFGFVPIMHVAAARRSLLDAAPGVAATLVASFARARTLAIEDGDSEAERSPIGLEVNASAIDAMLRYAHDQGLLAARISAEHLFG